MVGLDGRSERPFVRVLAGGRAAVFHTGTLAFAWTLFLVVLAVGLWRVLPGWEAFAAGLGKLGFLLRFMTGRMEYWVMPLRADKMVEAYAAEGRGVWAQRLNLTAAQRAALRDFLEWNVREENARGVTVFYISNRSVAESAGTLANLSRHGFPVAAQTRGSLGDSILLRDEQEGWGGDKSARRKAVAAHYRIIMLCGDDLGDFLPARKPREQRNQDTEAYMSWFGQRWIMLPNPMYGSWEDTLSAFDRSLAPEQARAHKLKALRRE